MSETVPRRNCASCGCTYIERAAVWDLFPQCSLCRQREEEKAAARSPGNVFRHWLQVAHGIEVSLAVAEDILKTAKG